MKEKMAPKKLQQSKACGRKGGVAVRQSARGRNNIMEFPFGENSESNDSERESERDNANNETFAAEPSDGEKEKFKTPGNGEDKENKNASGGQLSENANECESVPAGNESRSTRESSVGENPNKVWRVERRRCYRRSTIPSTLRRGSQIK